MSQSVRADVKVTPARGSGRCPARISLSYRWSRS